YRRNQCAEFCQIQFGVDCGRVEIQEALLAVAAGSESSECPGHSAESGWVLVALVDAKWLEQIKQFGDFLPVFIRTGCVDGNPCVVALAPAVDDCANGQWQTAEQCPLQFLEDGI